MLKWLSDMINTKAVWDFGSATICSISRSKFTDSIYLAKNSQEDSDPPFY